MIRCAKNLSDSGPVRSLCFSLRFRPSLPRLNHMVPTRNFVWPRDPGFMPSQGQILCTIPDLDRLYPGEDNRVSVQGVIVVQTLLALGLAEVDMIKIGVFNWKSKCKCVFSHFPTLM